MQITDPSTAPCIMQAGPSSKKLPCIRPLCISTGEKVPEGINAEQGRQALQPHDCAWPCLTSPSGVTGLPGESRSAKLLQQLQPWTRPAAGAPCSPVACGRRPMRMSTTRYGVIRLARNSLKGPGEDICLDIADVEQSGMTSGSTNEVLQVQPRYQHQPWESLRTVKPVSPECGFCFNWCGHVPQQCSQAFPGGFWSFQNDCDVQHQL